MPTVLKPDMKALVWLALGVAAAHFVLPRVLRLG